MLFPGGSRGHDFVGILPCPLESNLIFDGQRPAPWDRILACIGASPPSSVSSNPSRRQLWQPVVIALAMRPLLALVFPPALVASTYPYTDTTFSFQMDVTPRAPIIALPSSFSFLLPHSKKEEGRSC